MDKPDTPATLPPLSAKGFQALIEHSADVIVLNDQQGNITYVTPSITRTLGYAPQEFAGRNAFDLIHPEDRQTTLQKLQQLLEHPADVVTAEYRLKHKDGSWRWVQGSGRNLLADPEIGALVIHFRDITGSKESEAAISESEFYYRALVELAPDVIYDIDTQGNFTALSPAFERITGWVSSEWIGKPFVSIVHPDDVALAVQRFEEGMRDRTVSTFELRIRKKSGEYITAELHSTPRIVSGHVIGRTGIAQDISRRKEQEQLLISQQEEFRALVENSPDVIIRYNRGLQHVYVNPAIEAITGLPPTRFLGKTNEEMGMPPQQIAFWKEHVQRVFDSGEERNVEFDYPTAAGAFYMQTRLVPERNRDGVIEYVLCISRDITDIKRLSLHLKDERDRLTTIINSIADGIIVTDRDFNITIMNQAAAQLLDWPEQEAVGQPFGRVLKLLKDDQPVAEQDRLFRRAFSSQEPILTEIKDKYAYQSRTGRKFPVLISVSPIFDSDTTGIVNVFRDVTELVALDKAKSEFLSVAAHQLRTPLGLMRWQLEMVLGDEGALPPQVRDTIKKIAGTNLRIITLVNDLLNVSRIDQGKVVNNPEPTDIAAVVNRLIADAAYILTQRHITCTYTNTLPGEFRITIDPTRFTGTIQNLLSNAIKYSRNEGTVTVTSALDAGSVTLTFTDHGIGIPSDAMAKLFTKFYRAPNAALHDSDGNGLGLYVVKSYVERWGGTMQIRSTEGEGTTVTVRLPQVPR